MEKWRKISEEHHREKEDEDRRKAKEKEKGKAKVQEEQILQDMPDFELPHQMPEPPTFNTTRLTSLLLASTLMQTMKARMEETQHEDNAFKALQAVASTTSDNYKDDEAYNTIPWASSYCTTRCTNVLVICILVIPITMIHHI